MRFASEEEPYDVHLKSSAGRYVSPGVWTNDTCISPCIDSGDPAHPYGNEPEPNGRLLNLGVYGNTPEASRTHYYGALMLVR